ncbi:MAG: hypothetical protein EHM79_00805, partial [Geobacter sp.]
MSFVESPIFKLTNVLNLKAQRRAVSVTAQPPPEDFKYTRDVFYNTDFGAFKIFKDSIAEYTHVLFESIFDEPEYYNEILLPVFLNYHAGEERVSALNKLHKYLINVIKIVVDKCGDSKNIKSLIKKYFYTRDNIVCP